MLRSFIDGAWAEAADGRTEPVVAPATGEPFAQLGRLEHDRVAGRQRRADLPDRHQQRVVPRRDLPDAGDDRAARGAGERDPAARGPQRRHRPWRRGRGISEVAAGTLKRLHLELGGKAPVLIFDDADVEAAVAHIGATAFYNAGQDCTAPTRILAAPAVHDAVVEGLAHAARAQTIGDLSAPETTLGPLISAAHHTQHVAEMPHGGVKQSGTGRDLSVYALDDYTELKHVMTAHA